MISTSRTRAETGGTAVPSGSGEQPPSRPTLRVIAREWGRIGVIGFGGPPAHIALLRRRCVDERGWLTAEEFEDAVAACNLLPGPASTQLAIYCAWRLRDRAGALVGGAAFILPGLVLILGLAALFLAGSQPTWAAGLEAGAGAAVAAVAVRAGTSLVPASWRRAGSRSRVRWLGYLVAGGVAAATLGPWLVVILLGCGVFEVFAAGWVPRASALVPLPWIAGAAVATGGLASLAWVAFKVGALSYGGGFVIVPLMQSDAVHHYHWMTSAQFLNAVALGQVTPGPVVLTVAVVGYAAAGVGGALLATAVAFTPSFVFVLGGGARLAVIRRDERARSFLAGAGPCAIGAILGSAVPLALALSEPWQLGILAAAAVALLVARRGIVATLLGAASIGMVVGLAGGALPH
jgi:chromate transporter